MSMRKKIEEEEKESEKTEENIIEEESEEEEAEGVSKRKEALIVEEELEKEMEERRKKREEKEKILYRGNRITRWLRRNRSEFGLMIYALVLFTIIMIGLISALLLYIILGVARELTFFISFGLTIFGVILMIYIGRRYLLK